MMRNADRVLAQMQRAIHVTAPRKYVQNETKKFHLSSCGRRRRLSNENVGLWVFSGFQQFQSFHTVK